MFLTTHSLDHRRFMFCKHCLIHLFRFPFIFLVGKLTNNLQRQCSQCFCRPLFLCILKWVTDSHRTGRLVPSSDVTTCVPRPVITCGPPETFFDLQKSKYINICTNFFFQSFLPQYSIKKFNLQHDNH